MTDPLQPADEDYGEVDAQYPEPADYDVGSFPEPTRTGNSQLPKSYDVALAMQRVLEKRINDPDCPDSDKARLVVAWDKLEDRKRILRNKPLPGSLSHTGSAGKRISRPSTPIVMPDAKRVA